MIAAYRDTFRLLLHFVAKRRRIRVDEITFESLRPDAILAFLDHLQKERHNTTRTRNVRLAAIRAFARFTLGDVVPEFSDQAQRILAIPFARTPDYAPHL